MPKATYSGTEEAVQRTIRAYCSKYGYQPLLDDDVPNTETPVQFTERIIFNHIKQEVADWELQQLHREIETKHREEIAAVEIQVVRE